MVNLDIDKFIIGLRVLVIGIVLLFSGAFLYGLFTGVFNPN